MRKKGEGDAVQIILLPIQIDQFREIKIHTSLAIRE